MTLNISDSKNKNKKEKKKEKEKEKLKIIWEDTFSRTLKVLQDSEFISASPGFIYNSLRQEKQSLLISHQ